MWSVQLGPVAGGIWLAFVGVCYRRHADATRVLARRTFEMLPTLSAYLALFALALVVESAHGPETIEPAATLAGISALSLSIVGSWYMNDVLDRENDARSAESRATSGQAVTDRSLIVATALFWGTGLALAASVGPYLAGATAGMIAINVLYSARPIRLKATMSGSMVAIGLMGVSAVFHGSAAVASAPGPTVVRLAGLIAVLMVLNLSYKDLKDAYEDASVGDSNFVAAIGRTRTLRFLLVSLPVSYLAGTVVLGLVDLPVVVAVGALCAGVVFLLLTADPGDPALVYRLDMINASYLIVLTVAYYLTYG